MDRDQSIFPKPPTDTDLPNITTLSVVSGVLWIALGFATIHFFHEPTFFDVITEGSSITIQILSGLITGWLFGEIGRQFLRSPYLKETLDDYFIVKQLKELSLSNSQIVQVSVIAGISEEILFRAAIQPIIGIWLTSLIFIGVHGYIRFKTLGHATFTLFTFLLSVVLGLLFIYYGVISAMIAHAIYDIILLKELKNSKESNFIYTQN